MKEIMYDVSYSKVREMVKHCLCEVQAKTANIGVSGIPSGFSDLDELTDGFKEGKVPQFMDLANSSYIEELADVVMMMHRPEYYRIYVDERGRDLHGVMEVYVKKNNLNPLGCILLDYHEDTGIVTSRKDANASASKPVRLKDFNTENKAVKHLLESFGLVEELPF